MNFRSLASATALAAAASTSLLSATAFADIATIGCQVADAGNHNPMSIEAVILESEQLEDRKEFQYNGHTFSVALRIGDRHYRETDLTLRADSISAMWHSVDAGTRAELSGEDFYLQCWLK